MNKIEYDLKGKSGIYMFFNMVSGKRYVGSSVDIYNRIHEHYHNLENNKSHNAHFQSSWNKYGKDAFIYCVLEYCNAEDRFNREQYYIDSLKPEYNLTLNVVANFGHKVSEETKTKISNTLKERYKSGEIETYKQQHLWVTTYVYDVIDKKFVGKFPNHKTAIKFTGSECGKGYSENKLYGKRYCLSETKFANLNELVNHINKNVLVAISSIAKYIIAEDPDKNIYYFRNLSECAKFCGSSKSTLSKHSDARLSNPYFIRKTGFKFYYSDEYIPVKIDTAVPIEESMEELQTENGEICDDNPVLSSETKKIEPVQSIEIEPKKLE